MGQLNKFSPVMNSGIVPIYLNQHSLEEFEEKVSEITPELVRHLAGLSRIDLDDAEVARFTEQLSVIVDSVAKISQAIDENTPATSHPIPLSNVFRPDVVEPSLSQEQALSGAPDSGQGRFRVAAILDEE
jgi:aspartyl-tRNA(Asn)/glutamyl-tRNA(Gln) amidotransferase subunit C